MSSNPLNSAFWESWKRFFQSFSLTSQDSVFTHASSSPAIYQNERKSWTLTRLVWCNNITKESVYIRKELNSHRIGLLHKYGRHFIVLKHQYGCNDVMCFWFAPFTYDYSRHFPTAFIFASASIRFTVFPWGNIVLYILVSTTADALPPVCLIRIPRKGSKTPIWGL